MPQISDGISVFRDAESRFTAQHCTNTCLAARNRCVKKIRKAYSSVSNFFGVDSLSQLLNKCVKGGLASL